jgi:hypothetical protein
METKKEFKKQDASKTQNESQEVIQKEDVIPHAFWRG